MGKISEVVNQVVMCAECGTKAAWSRSLCNTCYSAANRGGYINDYPTQKFLDDPISHIGWAFGYHPTNVADVAIEYGYALCKQDASGNWLPV